MTKEAKPPFGWKQVALLGLVGGFFAEIGWVVGRVAVYYFLNLVVN